MIAVGEEIGKNFKSIYVYECPNCHHIDYSSLPPHKDIDKIKERVVFTMKPLSNGDTIKVTFKGAILTSTPKLHHRNLNGLHTFWYEIFSPIAKWKKKGDKFNEPIKVVFT